MGNTWERWGEEDPLFAVLSDKDKRHGGWEADDFMATGRASIAALLADLEGLGIVVPEGSVLDFGCGVGRLTMALSDHFDDVHGVDISAAMVDRARAVAEGAANPPTYHHNRQPDLALFDDDTFALVVTFLVLQHMPASDSLAYVREFVRVLAPGGVAVFQLPEAHCRPTRLLDSRWLPPRVRNAGVRMKGRVLRRPYMEMHMVKRAVVAAAAERAGGELVEAAPDASGGDFCRSVRYIARKPGTVSGAR